MWSRDWGREQGVVSTGMLGRVADLDDESRERVCTREEKRIRPRPSRRKAAFRRGTGKED